MYILPLLEGEKLSLTTPGHLEVFFLGTGGAFSTGLGNTNFLLVKGYYHLLVDFGITGPGRLWEKARLKPTDIDSLLLTHNHADHCGGVEQLAFMNYFLTKRKPVLWATEPFQRVLWDRTLSGGMEYLTGMNRPLHLNDYFQVRRPVELRARPMERHFFHHGPMSIELFRTQHIETPTGCPDFRSYGLVVDDQVFFSGDSLFCPETLRSFPRVHTYFHDCSIRPSGDTHATLEDLRVGIQNSDTKKRMFLVHYSDDYRGHDVSDFAGWAESGLRYIFD